MVAENDTREVLLADGGLHIRVAPVSVITINRPERLNALDQQLLVAIAEAVAMLEDDPTARVIILTGAGPRAFAAGADLSELSNISSDLAAAEKLSRSGQAAMARLATSRLPTIAAVNGIALGGGCELAISCDIRIAARGAIFGMPEVTLGLIPGFGGTQRLPRLIGRSAALRLILSGNPVDAEEALTYGLVDSVVDDSQVLDACMKLGARIASHNPQAVSAAKTQINHSMTSTIAEGLQSEAQSFAERATSQESRAAVAAFFASRRSAK
jgi:enoyl-CoA hydratase